MVKKLAKKPSRKSGDGLHIGARAQGGRADVSFKANLFIYVSLYVIKSAVRGSRCIVLTF